MRVVKHLRNNVVGYLALAVALSGTAYAATSLPANSVGTKQLKNKAVTLKKISPKARASLRGARGPQGPKGDAGQNGTHAITSGHASLTASTGFGTSQPLLTVGPVTYSANCLDQGGGQFRLEIRAQSTQSGLTVFRLASSNGNLDLTSTPQQVWFAFSTGAFGFSDHHLVRSTTGTLHWADVTLATHKPGYGDCFAGIDVTS